MYCDDYLLASDLDGTLIPPPGTEGDGGIAAFTQAVRGRPDLHLAYVTGRHKTLALQGIITHELPPPHVLVCDVGTSVFHLRRGEYKADPVYRELMAGRFGGTDRGELERRLAHPALQPQEAERQAEFKLSYYTPAGPAGEALARWAQSQLEDSVGGAKVVYSLDAETRRGLLDVLPPGVAKDVAVRYLHDRLGVRQNRLMYAGDSGNDRAAMLAGFNVVVVGNASSSLKESIREEAVSLGMGARVYFARDSFARGVLEGCRHFGIA